MVYFLIASHGKIASGFESAINILTGSTKRMFFFDAYIDGKNAKEELERMIHLISERDQLVMISDIYGGSVNQIMSELLGSNHFLVTGANLPCILELVIMERETISREEIQEIIKQSRESIKLVDLSNVEIDDDFF